AFAADAHAPAGERADAVAALAADADAHLKLLMDLAAGENAALRDEALRALAGAKLSDAQRDALRQLAQRVPQSADAVARAVGDPRQSRPDSKDTASWLALVEGPGDHEAGRR